MPTLLNAENWNTQDVRIKPQMSTILHWLRVFLCICLYQNLSNQVVCSEHSRQKETFHWYEDDFVQGIECHSDCTREEIWDEKTVIISSFHNFHITRKISQRLLFSGSCSKYGCVSIEEKLQDSSCRVFFRSLVHVNRPNEKLMW